MSRILILGAGTQALAIINSLRKGKHYIALLTSERSNYADDSRFVDKLCLYNDSDDKRLVDFINDIITKDSIDVIIPMGDADAAFLCKNKSLLTNIVKFNLPSYEDFQRGYDKNQLMSHCAEKGYPHPRTIDLSITDILDDEARHFDYPAMLKPNCTTGGRGMVEIKSHEELVEKYPSLHEQYGDYHLQKFIRPGGRQVKIQLYIDENKELVAHSVQQKQRWYPVKGGSNCCAISIEEDNMVGICHHILKEINWIGFADFDLIEDPDTHQLLIMEINPRVPACIKGSIVAGINWGEIVVNGYLGLPQKKYEYRTGVVLRHLGLDILWFKSSDKRFSTKPCWFSFIGRNIYYQDMSHWSDPMPFIKGTFHNIMKLFNPSFKNAKQI